MHVYRVIPCIDLISITIIKSQNELKQKKTGKKKGESGTIEKEQSHNSCAIGNNDFYTVTGGPSRPRDTTERDQQLAGKEKKKGKKEEHKKRTDLSLSLLRSKLTRKIPLA